MRNLSIIFLLLLTGCPARPIMQTPDSISIEHDALLRSGAFSKAAAHCAKYGKNAVHLSTTGNVWAVSSFRCE